MRTSAVRRGSSTAKVLPLRVLATRCARSMPIASRHRLVGCCMTVGLSRRCSLRVRRRGRGVDRQGRSRGSARNGRTRVAPALHSCKGSPRGTRCGSAGVGARGQAAETDGPMRERQLHPVPPRSLLVCILDRGWEATIPLPREARRSAGSSRSVDQYCVACYCSTALLFTPWHGLLPATDSAAAHAVRTP